MKMIVIPRETYSYLHAGKVVKQTYFGNVLANNANIETLAIWDDTKTDYKYLDEVYIPELNTKYTATVDNPVGHPSTSSGWFAEGINAYKISDHLFTSQTVYSGDAIIDFEASFMTHIIGQNIDYADSVTISTVNADGTTGETLHEIELSYVEFYDCDTCCNPEPVQQRHFYAKLDPLGCNENTTIRCTFKMSETSTFMTIGTLAVGHAYDLGCVLSGATIEKVIPENIIEFPAIQQTGVYAANIQKRFSAVTRVKYSRVDDLDNLIDRHGTYLNFYLFDARDDIKNGILLGRCTTFKYTVTPGAYAYIPIEAYGVQN